MKDMNTSHFLNMFKMLFFSLSTQPPENIFVWKRGTFYHNLVTGIVTTVTCPTNIKTLHILQWDGFDFYSLAEIKFRLTIVSELIRHYAHKIFTENYFYNCKIVSNYSRINDILKALHCEIILQNCEISSDEM